MDNKKQKGAPVFYIILCFCVAAIGIMGYFTGHDSNSPDSTEIAQNDNSSEVSSEFIAEDPAPSTEAPTPAPTPVPVPTAEPVTVITPETLSPEEEVPEDYNAETYEEDLTAEPDVPVSVALAAEDITFLAPITGEIKEEFSQMMAYNQILQEWRTHDGVDIAAEKGTAVTAAADGAIEEIFTDYLGTSVLINHNGGYKIRYANIDTSLAEGTEVHAGDVIGTVSDIAAENYSDPHLHLELWEDDKLCNPTDKISFQ